MPAITAPIVLNDGTTDHTLKPVNNRDGVAQFTALRTEPGVFDFMSVAVTGQPGANHKVKLEVRLPEIHTMPDASKVTYVDIAKVELNLHRMNSATNSTKLRTMLIDALAEAIVVACTDSREHIW